MGKHLREKWWQLNFPRWYFLKQVAPLNSFNTSSLFSQPSPNFLTKNTHTKSGVIQYVKWYCILKPDFYFRTQHLLLWSLNASLAHLLFVVVVAQSKSCLTQGPHGLPHARLPCPPLSPIVCSDSCPLSRWCYITISSSAGPFSFCLQSSQIFSYSSRCKISLKGHGGTLLSKIWKIPNLTPTTGREVGSANG